MLLPRFLTQMFSKLPLRVVLIGPFVLQILLVAGLIGFLSFQNGQQAVKELVTRLELEVGQQVEQTLQSYLRMPQLANQITADMVRQGLLDVNDLEGLQEYLWAQFRQFSPQYSQPRQYSKAPPNPQPDDISFLGIGTAKGEYVDVGFNTQYSRLEMSILDRTKDETLRVWELNSWGKPLQVVDKFTPYDPRSRPWYQEAVQAGRLVWIKPYFPVIDSNQYFISADQPLYDRQGNLVGVVDATLSLKDVSDFLYLRREKLGATGQIFVIQLNGDLLATSTGEVPFTGSGSDLRSVRIEESSNPLTRETAAYLQQEFGSFDRISYLQQQQARQLEFRDSQHRKHFVRVQSLRDAQFPGIDWLTVITVPEEDFMGQIYANRRITTLTALAGLAGTIAFGIWTGRWLTRPLVQLSRAADAMAQGDWERPVTIQRSGELGSLVNAFNHMRQEVKQSQHQLEQYSYGLEQKNEQLETLEAELRRQLNLFLHAVSHDLRNPVLGSSMVLNHLSQQPGETVMLPRKVLERMQESNQRQLDLINSLIDAHSTEMWGIMLYPKPLALRPLVQSALSDLQPLIEKEQAHLINQIPADLPFVQVDPLQLARVYQNLLANALKHNPSGLQIVLTATVKDNQDGKDHFVYCTVSDNGVGIPSEQCEKLFDPYFRGSSKSKSVGLGLGLYLCQQIVAAHSGRIGVTSEPGQGTTFWFTLPLTSTNLSPQKLS